MQRSGKETPSSLVCLKPRECEVGTIGCKGGPGSTGRDLAGQPRGLKFPGIPEWEMRSELAFRMAPLAHSREGI